MITFKAHDWNSGYDACRRCWVTRKVMKFRPATLCQVPDDSLHLAEGERGESGGLEWHSNPAYWYYCPTCDFLCQFGNNGAVGDGYVHECRHGNRGIAKLFEPLEVLTEFLQTLHFKRRDPYAEHRESLRGIEVVDLRPDDELGDAWSSATWEEL